jgi:hypothetical protein
MNRTVCILIAAFLALAAADARAQGQRGGWAFEVQYMPGSGGVVSPAFPEATVRLLAWFDPPQVAHGGDADIVASDGLWTNARLLDVGNPMGPQPPGTSPGTIHGPAVRGVITGQLGWCGVAGCPQPREFTPFWEGTWRAEDFSPRNVEMVTENTTRFAYYDYRTHPPTSVPLPAIPGSGQIRVVPAPGAALVMAGALAGVLGARRRARDGSEETRI